MKISLNTKSLGFMRVVSKCVSRTEMKRRRISEYAASFLVRVDFCLLSSTFLATTVVRRVALWRSCSLRRAAPSFCWECNFESSSRSFAHVLCRSPDVVGDMSWSVSSKDSEFDFFRHMNMFLSKLESRSWPARASTSRVDLSCCCVTGFCFCSIAIISTVLRIFSKA